MFSINLSWSGNLVFGDHTNLNHNFDGLRRVVQEWQVQGALSGWDRTIEMMWGEYLACQQI